jgi:CRISPR-associated protein Csx10
MKTLELHITFSSDWHIGTGRTVVGGVDAVVARDAEGFPCVPAKSVTGILRDAAENLAVELADDWLDFVGHVFGDEVGEQFDQPSRPARVAIRMARLPVVLRDGLKRESNQKEGLVRELFLLKSSTAINNLGIAQDDTLRTIEVVRAGTLLIAPVQIRSTPNDIDQIKYFLAAAARLVEAIGGKRRRGLGRATVRLFEDGGEVVPRDGDWDTTLKLTDNSDEPLSQPEEQRVAEGKGGHTHNGGQLLSITINAQSPLLLASEVRGNQWSSHDYVGGNLLLPIVHRAVEQCGVDAFRAVRNGHLQVRRGNPAAGKLRLQRIPFVFKEPKGNSDDAWQNELFQTNDAAILLKSIRSGWVSTDGNIKKKVSGAEFAHNTIDNATQSTGDAGLYTYRALPAGSFFRAEVWLSDDLVKQLGDLNTLIQKLNGHHAVGRSKKDDYGWVELSAEKIAGGDDGKRTSAQQLRIWCVSDVLLRNSRLQYEPTAIRLVEELANCLGINHETIGNVDMQRSHVRTQRIESWSSAWSLPRPTLVAVAAGSVIVVDLREEMSFPARMTIGDRQAEGFGEILLNPELLSKNKVQPTKVPVATTAAVAGALSAHDTSLIESLAVSATIRRIASTASFRGKEGLSKLKWSDKEPTNTQIGKIRALVRDGVANGRKTLELPKALERNLKLNVKDRLKELLRDPSLIATNDEWDNWIVLPSVLSVTKEEFKKQVAMRALQIVIEVAHHERTRG